MSAAKVPGHARSGEPGVEQAYTRGEGRLFLWGGVPRACWLWLFLLPEFAGALPRGAPC